MGKLNCLCLRQWTPRADTYFSRVCIGFRLITLSNIIYCPNEGQAGFLPTVCEDLLALKEGLLVVGDDFNVSLVSC